MKQALDLLGYKSTVVQCKEPPAERYRVVCKRLTPAYIKEYFGKLRVYQQLRCKYENTCAFIRQYVNTAYFTDLDAMAEGLKDGKIFIAGSDQVWNPIKLAPEFFLEFAPEGAKKLSYAASMGMLNIPDQRKERFGEMIRNFDQFSVREADCGAVVSQFTDKPVQVHIDPTFFCDRAWWRTVQRPYPIREPYILVYPLYWDPSLNEQLRHLHERTGKQIVVIADYRRNIYADRWVHDADPAQFLWLIDHADEVVSSSFHGAALALNYNKSLATVINPAAPSRLNSLLETLGYPHRSIEDLGNGQGIDFAPVNARILAEKEKGISYLKEILK
jgi:hypothetical protein